MINYPRCRTCKHYTQANRAAYDYRHKSLGSCSRWLMGYGVEPETVALNEVLVEDDEDWGAAMGPDFGCVLHEQSPT